MAESFRSPAKVARRMKMLPMAMRHVRNWPTFMYNYALGKVPSRPYHFRNGAKLKIGRGVDHVPIIEIFMRKDYGRFPQAKSIVDLGASVGVFSVYAAAEAPAARIYAYEPMPEAFHLVQENVGLNDGTDRIKSYDYAVGGEIGSRTLYLSGTDFFFPTLLAPIERAEPANVRQTTVHCTTLAEIVSSNGLETVDLLKMDVEGAEYEFLYGADSETLRKVSEIRMEYHDLDEDRRNVSSLKTFLKNSGFVVTREDAVTPTNGNLWVRR